MMKRYVFSNQNWSKLLRVEDAEPECGKDFCDRCGDCLSCFEGDPCYDGMDTSPEHYWVTYEDEPEDVSP